MSSNSILGEHPARDAFGSYTIAEDCLTGSDIPHRALTQDDNVRNSTINQLREALIDHHVSASMIAQDRRIIQNLISQGYPVNSTRRFPIADKTRKGNLAEVFLAEYICSATSSELPVYRLRYNPNVEQSMKGDDILAFDFVSQQPRIIVGEAKFRGTPSKKAVQDIVSGLIRSHQAGLPTSLQFVADRLYESNNTILAVRVANCAIQFVTGRLDINYVGLLISDTNSKSNVDQHTEGSLRNLVMISLGINNPSQLVNDCFERIEESL